MKITSKLTIIFLAFSLLTALMGFALLFGINSATRPIDKSLSKTIEDIFSATAFEDLSSDMVLYDEILTQSARNYAFTQNKKWEQRYREFELKLDDCIKKAAGLGDKAEKELLKEIDVSNLALVEMEHRAIDSVKNGQSQEAAKILDSDGYWKEKELYKKALDGYRKIKLLNQGAIIGNALRMKNSLVKESYSLKAVSERIVIVFILFALILSFTLNWAFARYISGPIEQFKKFADKIGQGDLSGGIKIETKDELGDLARSFNQMMGDLRQTTVSKGYLDEIIENIKDCVIVTDLDGNIRTVNKSVFDQLGFSKKDLIGRNISALISEENSPLQGNGRKKLFEQNALINYESFCNTKVNKVIPALTTCSLMKNEKGEASNILYVIKDITMSKKIEETMRASEKKYRHLFEESGDTIFVADTRTRVLVDCNKKAEEMFGWTRAELLTMTADKLHPQDKVAETMEGFRQQIEGKIQVIESEIITKDKKIIPVSICASMVDIEGRARLVGIFRNISEQKQAENIIKEREERFRTLIENLNVGVYRGTAGPQGKFIQTNLAHAHILGYDSVEELMQISISDSYQDPQDRELFLKEMTKNGYVKNREVVLRKKDGTFVLAAITAKAKFDDNGQVLWVDGIIEDITDRKRMETSLNDKLEDLKQFKEAALDRENRVIELKKEVNSLAEKLGLPAPYDMSFLE